MKKFSNKTVLITGGTSGIGFAVAEEFIKEGALIYITGRSQTTLDKAANRLGQNAEGFKFDASKKEDIKNLHKFISDKNRKLDAVFANAGVFETNLLGKTEEHQFDRIFNVNVKGLFFTVQAIISLMKLESSITLNASLSSDTYIRDSGLYSASKSAVKSFVLSWSNELKKKKIRVNSVSPGIIKTPMLTKELKKTGMSLRTIESYLQRKSLSGRAGTAKEVAHAVLFLASAEAGYINGIDVPVDGGWQKSAGTD